MRLDVTTAARPRLMLIGRAIVLLILCGLVAGVPLAHVGAAPATAPAEPIRAWFEQLADPDPDVRATARINLMGLSRRQLDTLRSVVAESRPLLAAQRAELYDIVIHAYSAGEPYHAEPIGGFLGVRLRPEPSNDPPGVVVHERVIGFCAYRFLRDGDVIVGIREMPGITFNSTAQLTAVLSRLRAGTTITLRLVRSGQTLEIPIPLDARPAAAAAPLVAGDGPMAQLEAVRMQRALEYWNQTFAPLVPDDGITSVRPEV